MRWRGDPGRGARRGEFGIRAGAWVSVVGGLLGIGFGVAAALVLPELLTDLLTAIFRLPQIVLAFGVACAVGLVFGVLPAYRSAQMAPVEAPGRE